MSNPHLIKNLNSKIAKELIASHTYEASSPELCRDPLVSVMVNTYQHKKFIRQCMDGILMQKTSFPFEIVVGDDGSTDGSYEILCEYQKKHPEKIRLFHSTTNLGRYTGNGRLNSARSRYACRGKYIAFVEGDDYWTSPDKLQRQAEILEANPSFSGAFHDVEIIGDYYGELIFVEYGSKKMITFEDQLTFDTPMALGSMMGKRELLLGLPEWHWNCTFGDRLLMALLTNHGPMARIREKLGVYRRHSGGITVTGTLASYEATARTFQMFIHKKEFFGIRSKDYYDYMLRFTYRLMLRKFRDQDDRLQRARIMFTCTLQLGLKNLFLVVLEYFGRPCRYQSANIKKKRKKSI